MKVAWVDAALGKWAQHEAAASYFPNFVLHAMSGPVLPQILHYSYPPLRQVLPWTV